MAIYDGTSGWDTIDISSAGSPYPNDAHFVNGFGGNDIINGSNYVDYLIGGDGSDTLYGNNGDDIIVGGTGNDKLHGGNGDDRIYGGDGADVLWGDAGNDVMWGGDGNDHYVHRTNEGVDIINDDKSATGLTGFGGGDDDILEVTFDLADLGLYRIGDDLWVTTTADVADGVMDDGSIIQDFFLGGNNVVEHLYTLDGYDYDLTIHL